MLNFLKKYRQIRTPEQRKKLKKERILLSISGIFLGLSYPPFPLPYFAFVALIPYLKVLETKNGLGEINRATYLTMFFFNLVTLYWVGSWTPEADPFLKISGIVLVFFNPTVYLIPSTLYFIAKKYFDKKMAIYIWPFLWVFFEFIYTVTEFRFPWLTLGNSQAFFPSFIQVAELIGVYGLSILILFSNVLLYQSWKIYSNSGKILNIFLITYLVSVVIILSYGNVRLNSFEEPQEKLKIGVVQPNLNPWNKWSSGGVAEILESYLEQTDELVDQNCKVIFWPETALPVYLLTGQYNQHVNRILNYVSANDINLITGMPDAKFYNQDDPNLPDDAKESSNDFYYTSYNSILHFTPNSKKIDRYGKIKLVPFGEKVPYAESIPFLGDLIKWNVGISSWNTGSEIKNFTLFQNVDSVSIGAVICIESIYPEFVAEFVGKGAEMIAVVTNDSWYGDSSGPYQHKAISVIRAVENRRYVVRCANGGISCIINPMGNTLKSTKMFEKTTLAGFVGLTREKTFYTKNPNLIPYLSVFLTVLILINFLLNRFFAFKINKIWANNENN
ncbi:MAG: apolipoprotein N-acyltransferase [Melioribacteraceae bacterium]|nr:apolipoprotein N-acyltransferase [Melioribacteraceae bacterium]MCF8265265.1 apolipoprotein N-acyltransferase [Melioribacteraceae bacterium]